MREATVERATAETWVWLRLGLDGPTGGKVDTGLPFLDHMLLQLQRHGRFLLEVEARGTSGWTCTTWWRTWASPWGWP